MRPEVFCVSKTFPFSDTNAQACPWGSFHGLAYGLSWRVCRTPLRGKYVTLLGGASHRGPLGPVGLQCC